MSVPLDQCSLRTEAAPQLTITPNWTIDVSDIKTVKVSNISLAATEQDIEEFFPFSGDIHFVEMQSESERSQLAYVTFKDSQGADTAILLSGATIVDLSVTITPDENYQLPPEAHKYISGALKGVVQAAEDVGVMTREKVEKEEEQRKDNICKERNEMVSEYAQLHLEEISAKRRRMFW